MASRDVQVYYRGLSIFIFFLEGTLDRQHVYILTERHTNCSFCSLIARVSHDTCILSCTIKLHVHRLISANVYILAGV